MDHRGVAKFLTGSRPRPSTRKRLEEWYARWTATQPTGMDPATAHAALRLLLSGIPRSDRDRASVEAITALRRIYRQYSASEPIWLELASDLEYPEQK